MSEMTEGWPDGRTIAVSVSVMLEGWSDGAAPGVGPMGNPLKPGVLDLQARSWAEYGPNVGAWRLLDVLARAGATAVFYVSGVLAERYPLLMRSIVDAGHTVAGHSWGQDIIPATQTRAEEERDLTHCIAACEAATGVPLRGWLSPRCTPSTATAELLASNGFIWHADYFDQDLPRILEMPSGPLVAVPFTMEVNDMPLYVRYGNEPAAFTATFERIVSEAPATDARPFCLDITVHAHVFGRPYGAIEFKKTLDLARRRADRVWLTDHARLAALYATPGTSGTT
jgi:Polysaccharide deacetylase